MYSEEEKTKIYTDFSPKVSNYIFGKTQDSQLTEDLCSDVFVKIYASLDSFDKNKASLSTWIYHITQNTLYDYFRTKRNVIDIEKIPELIDSKESIEEGICNEEVLEQLSDALEKLDEKHRNLILLHYYGNYTLKDISLRMGVSYNYVKILHKEALNKLENLLDD